MTTIDRTYGVAEGIAIKAPCRVATTANITLSGLQSIDGVTTVANDRVLVKDQSVGANNGIYAASSGNWLREADFDGAYDIVHGTLVLVTSGTVSANRFYAVSAANPITIGTTAITFEVNTSITGYASLTANNAFSGSQTIAPAQGTTKALTITQVGPDSGTIGSTNFAYNKIAVANDQLSASSPQAKTSALSVEQSSYGADTGTKSAFHVAQSHPIASVATGDYIGADFEATSDASMGGTNTGAGANGTLFGVGIVAQANSGTTNLFEVAGGEVDVSIETGASAKYRFGWSVVGGGQVQGATFDAALEIGSSDASGAWQYGLLLTGFHGAKPLSTTATVLGTDASSHTVANFADFATYTFTGNIFNFPNFQVTGNGNLSSSTLTTAVPTIQTGATYTMGNNDSVIILNHAGTVTLTLVPSVAGRWVYIKTVTANAVESASSNIVPLIGGAAGTAILAGTAGKWAKLQSTGTNWEIIASN